MIYFKKRAVLIAQFFSFLKLFFFCPEGERAIFFSLQVSMNKFPTCAACEEPVEKELFTCHKGCEVHVKCLTGQTYFCSTIATKVGYCDCLGCPVCGETASGFQVRTSDSLYGKMMRASFIANCSELDDTSPLFYKELEKQVSLALSDSFFFFCVRLKLALSLRTRSFHVSIPSRTNMVLKMTNQGNGTSTSPPVIFF